MKFFIMLVSVPLILLIACDEVNEPLSVNPEFGSSDKDGLAKGVAKFVIDPSGDLTGVTDWSNINSAFEQAVASTKPCVIKLGCGNFYLHRPIKIAGFSGTIKGSGKHVTIIEPAMGEENLGYEPILLEEYYAYGGPGLDYYATPMFYFTDPQNYVKISDLSVEINELNIAQTWGFKDASGNLSGPMPPSNEILAAFIIWLNEDCDTEIKNVSISGVPRTPPPGGWHYASPFLGTWIQGNTDWETFTADWPGGHHSLKKCDFNTVGSASHSIGEIGNATFTIGGSPQDKNTFQDCYSCIDIWDLSNCHMEISYNIFRNAQWDGVFLWNNGDLQPIHQLSTVLVFKNEINASGWADGLIFMDDLPAFYGAVKSLDVTVRKNRINLDVEGTGGIFSRGLRDARIFNNKVSGKGFAAFYSYYTEGMTLARLHTKDFEPEAAHIYLGTGTNECKIYGQGLEEKVYDWSDDPATPEYDGTNYLWKVNLTPKDFFGKSKLFKQNNINEFKHRYRARYQALVNQLQ